MRKKTVSGMTLTLLLVGALSLVFSMERAAEQTHDIAVTNVMNSKTVVGQGYCVDVAVVVENLGDVSESFNVTAYYSSEILTFEQWETFWREGDVDRDGYIDMIDVALFDEAVGSVCGDPNYNLDCDFDQDCFVGSSDAAIIDGGLGSSIWAFFNGGSIGRQVVTDLSATDSTVVVFTWNTTDVPYGNYTISAKSLRVRGEPDITNNIYDDGWVVVTLPGDIDGDYYVGSEDAGVQSVAYGAWAGEPLYVPEADFDCDGYIGSADAGILSGNYGKTAI